MSSRLVRINPQVVFRRLGDRMVLVQLHTNQIFELNDTSARFWELLSRNGDVTAVEAQLAAEYDVDPARLREEIDRTLAFLTEEQLTDEVSHD